MLKQVSLTSCRLSITDLLQTRAKHLSNWKYNTARTNKM